MVAKWSKESIAAEIRHAHASGEDLSYSGVTKNNMALLRAATRYFGGWEAAVTFAGLCYDDLRKYRVWTNERIVERIRELRGQKADLSWRQVSGKTDPGLAAAAVRPAHFGSWRAAIEAAGLDYERIRRYRRWTREGVLHALCARQARGGQAMNAKALEINDVALLTAARRRFVSWKRALTAAGVEEQRVNVPLRSFARRWPAGFSAPRPTRSRRLPKPGVSARSDKR